MIFFDQGHPEYTTLFRKSVRYLPTGIDATNQPLDMFMKDGNMKISSLSYFVQIADLVAHAALLKRRHELGRLQAKRARHRQHELYDQIPIDVLNSAATTRRDDGIVLI